MSSKGNRTSSSVLMRNSVWNVSANFVTGASTFFVVPFMLRYLGQERYGIWILIGSAFAYSSVFGFGLSSAINRYIPVSLARGTDDDIRRVTSTGTVFFAAVAALLAVLTGAFYLGLTHWFRIPADMVDSARKTVLIVGACASAAVLAQAFEAVLSGYQRYDLTGMTRVTMIGLRATVVITALIYGAGLLQVALIYGLTEVGIKLMNYLFCRHLTPPRLFVVTAFDGKLLKEMLGYGINTFLYSTGTLLTYKASELVIGTLLRTQDVALYSVAATGVLVLSSSIISICAAIKPAASDLDARGENHSVRELSLVSQKYTLFLIVPSAAFLIIMGKEFLHVWTRLTAPQLPIILALLAIAQSIQLSQYSNFMVLVGKGEHRMFGLCVVLIGVSTIALGVLNVRVFHWGLIGVAVANLLPLIIFCGIVIPHHVNQKLGLTVRERFERVWRPVLAGCLPSIVLLSAWKILRPPSTWVEIIAVVLVTAFLTALVSWRVGLDQRERGRFASLLFHKIPKLRSAVS